MDLVDASSIDYRGGHEMFADFQAVAFLGKVPEALGDVSAHGADGIAEQLDPAPLGEVVEGEAPGTTNSRSLIRLIPASMFGASSPMSPTIPRGHP